MEKMTHDKSHPLSNGGLTCFCCRDLYFCTVCNDNIVRVKPKQEEPKQEKPKDDFDELLWAITSVAKQDPCETLGHWPCAKALRAVLELTAKDITHESYMWLDGYNYAMQQIVETTKKEIKNDSEA